MTQLNNEIIQQKLREKISEAAEIRVAFDGSKAHIIVVLEAFASMRRIQKQQLIYGALQAEIADGSIHAVTMETLTPEEWDKVKMFR